MKKTRATAKKGSAPNGARLTLSPQASSNNSGNKGLRTPRSRLLNFSCGLLSLMKEMEEERGIDEIRVKWVARDTVAR